MGAEQSTEKKGGARQQKGARPRADTSAASVNDGATTTVSSPPGKTFQKNAVWKTPGRTPVRVIACVSKQDHISTVTFGCVPIMMIFV